MVPVSLVSMNAIGATLCEANAVLTLESDASIRLFFHIFGKLGQKVQKN